MAIPVLYISYDGMTDPLGQSQVIPYLAGLTKEGYSFTLISCEKPELFEKNKEYIAELLLSHNIVWRPLSYTRKPPVISTIYDVYRIRKKATQLYKENRFRIVHCRSYIAALVGLEMKQKFSTPFIFDMRGLWADERVDGKLWNLSNPLYHSVYKFFKKKEKQFLRNADHTICLTENAKEEILSWPHQQKPEITVIPCCVDLSLFNPETVDSNQVNKLRNELKISGDEFVLMYLGSIGTWYMLDEMMEFYCLLKKKYSKSKFLFITRDEHARILAAAKKLNVEADIILRPAARHEIPALIALSVYSIFFILPSYSKKASSPTKQGEIMAMGVPVICNTNVGDTDHIVRKYHSGFLIDKFTQDDYASAISRLDQKFDQEVIRTGAMEFFSLKNGIKKYAAIYADILAKA